MLYCVCIYLLQGIDAFVRFLLSLICFVQYISRCNAYHMCMHCGAVIDLTKIWGAFTGQPCFFWRPGCERILAMLRVAVSQQTNVLNRSLCVYSNGLTTEHRSKMYPGHLFLHRRNFVFRSKMWKLTLFLYDAQMTKLLFKLSPYIGCYAFLIFPFSTD